jgi:putative SOS response-associated peptidase YedK
MCNVYSMTKGQEAIRSSPRCCGTRPATFRRFREIFPDYPAPIVRNSPEGRELVMARWACHPQHSRSSERIPTTGLPTLERELAPLAVLI